MLGRWHWESTTLTAFRACGTESRAYSLLSNAQTGELDSLQIFVMPASGKIAGFGLMRGVRVPVAPADNRERCGSRGFSTHAHAAHGREWRVLRRGPLRPRRTHPVPRGARHCRTARPDVARSWSERYSIASTGKLITATALMQLVEQGRLSLDDTLGKFLGPGERPAAAVGRAAQDDPSHTDGMTRGSDSLAFAPGTRFSYVNYGYYILGLVVEKVTASRSPSTSRQPSSRRQG
jgi:hypothetical protein